MTDPEPSLSMPDTSHISTPPESLEELRNLSLRIARGEAELRLGPKAQEVLSQLLELSGDQALLSISTAARYLRVNPSTISRLARSLGYKRFSDLQSVLLSPTLSRSFYREHANTALGADREGLHAQAERLCAEHQQNIARFGQGVRQEELAAFAQAVMGAGRVRFYGIRQFHSLCSFMAYGLGMIRADVELLSDTSGGIAEGLAAMAPNDVLIAASCKPYTRQVINVCRVAHEQGLKTLVVTDLASSPLVSHSNVAILVPHDTSFISNSMVAFFAAAECLINACATVAGAEAAGALSRRDQFIGALDIEVT